MIIIIIFIIINIFIFNSSGIIGLIPFWICILNIFVASISLLDNPDNIIFKFIQTFSIFLIILILVVNASNVIANFLFIWPILPLPNPFSHNKITFLDEVLLSDEEGDELDIIYISNPQFTWFHFNDYKEISEFLNTLDKNKVYLITFDLILNPTLYNTGEPSLWLTKPILITRESNPWLLSKYLLERLNIVCNSYYIDYTLFDADLSIKPSVLVRYKQILLTSN